MYHVFWGLASILIGLGLAVPTYLHLHEHERTPFSDQPLLGLGGVLALYGLLTALAGIWRRRARPLPLSMAPLLLELAAVLGWSSYVFSEPRANQHATVWPLVPFAIALVMFIGLLQGCRWVRFLVRLGSVLTTVWVVNLLFIACLSPFFSYSDVSPLAIWLGIISGIILSSMIMAFSAYFIREPSPAIPTRDPLPTAAPRRPGYQFRLETLLTRKHSWQSLAVFIGIGIIYLICLCGSFSREPLDRPLNKVTIVPVCLGGLCLLAVVLLSGPYALRHPSAKQYFSSALADRSRRPWYQYQLKTLLHATSLVAVLMGLFVIYVQPYRARNAALVRLMMSESGTGGRYRIPDAANWLTRVIFGGPKLEPIDAIAITARPSAQDIRDLHVLSQSRCILYVGYAITDDDLLYVLSNFDVTEVELPAQSRLSQTSWDAIAKLDLDALRIAGLTSGRGERLDLSNMRHLRQLDLQNFTCTAPGFFVLPKSTQLWTLSLRNSTFTDEDLRAMGHCLAEFVDLSGTRIRGACLSQFVRAGHLNLANSSLCDDGMPSPVEFHQLIDLDLSGCAITGQALRQIRFAKNDWLPAVSLSVGRTKITDDDLAVLASWENLESLSLENSAIDGSGLKYLANNPRLRELNLCNTEISEEGLRSLLLLPNLSLLYLNEVLIPVAKEILSEEKPQLQIMSN